MSRWSRIIAALAIKNVLHMFAIAWVSVVVLVSRFVRPEVIEAVGARYWMMMVLPLFILLFMIWISFVAMARRNPVLFSGTSMPRARRKTDHASAAG